LIKPPVRLGASVNVFSEFIQLYMYPVHVLQLDTLTEYIKRSEPLDIVIYEFHTTMSAEFNTSSFEEFKKRSATYYIACISLDSYVDDWPAKIDHAIKIRGEWYFCLESSSNFYLGQGPTSLIALRKICFEKEIPILVSNNSIMEFAYGRFPDYRLPPYFSYPPQFENSLDVLREKNKSQRKQSTTLHVSRSKKKQINYEHEFKSINGNVSEAKIIMQVGKHKHQMKKEPQLRDDLLDLLNMSLKKKGFGEAKRGNGLTDISIPTGDDKMSFIYECKIGITFEKFKKALSKLFDPYVAYHEKHCGIILFSRQLNFSKLVNKIPSFIKKTNGTSLDIAKDYSEEFRCSYKRPTDKGDVLEVFICAINLK
jgi:hypothetical protein